MEAMKIPQVWNDDRLDGLSRRTDNGFARMDERFEKLESRLDRRFERSDEILAGIGATLAKIDERFERVDERFVQVEAVALEARAEVRAHHVQTESRIDRLQQTILLIGGGLIGTLLLTCVTMLGIVAAA